MHRLETGFRCDNIAAHLHIPAHAFIVDIEHGEQRRKLGNTPKQLRPHERIINERPT